MVGVFQCEGIVPIGLFAAAVAGSQEGDRGHVRHCRQRWLPGRRPVGICRRRFGNVQHILAVDDVFPIGAVVARQTQFLAHLSTGVPVSVAVFDKHLRILGAERTSGLDREDTHRLQQLQRQKKMLVCKSKKLAVIRQLSNTQ